MAQQGKEYKPNDQDRIFVEQAIKAGATINKIAECLRMSDDTLRKYYKYEIAVARQNLVNKAVGVIDDSLTDGSLDAAKYVLSRVAGWTEKQSVDHTTNGKDMPPAIDLGKAPPELLEWVVAQNDATDKE